MKIIRRRVASISKLHATKKPNRMTNEIYLVYRRFESASELNELTTILEENEIPYVLENNTPHFDPGITNSITKEMNLKLRADDFEIVNQLISKVVQIENYEIPGDHYLYSFNNEELKDILRKQDDWGSIDIALAKEILKKRNVNITETELKTFKDQRILELSKPDDPNFYWILIGYGFAIIGGIIGILWGLFLMTHKKTLPNGKVVQGYSMRYQKHGFAILVLSILMTIFFIYRRFG